MQMLEEPVLHVPCCITTYKCRQTPIVWLNCSRAAYCWHLAWKIVPICNMKPGASPAAPHAMSRDTSTDKYANFSRVFWESSLKRQLLRWAEPPWWEADRGSPDERKAGWSRDTVAMATLPGKDKRGNLWLKGNSWNRRENGAINAVPAQQQCVLWQADTHSSPQMTKAASHSVKQRFLSAFWPNSGCC